MRSKYGPEHDAFYSVFSRYSGQTFTTAEIAKMMQNQYNYKSILPNDHGHGNKGACGCAGTDDRIFDRIRVGLYKVR